MKQKMKTTVPKKEKKSEKEKAKDWYEKLYKEYDLVIHLDGKSMEDQERVWKN